MILRRSIYVRLAVIVYSVFLGVSCVLGSCSAPLRGVCADQPSSAGLVVDFVNDLNQGMAENLEALGEDLANGNLDATSALAKKRAKYAALQIAFMYHPELALAYNASNAFLEGYTSDWENLPSSVTISGGACGAFYQSHIDRNIHFVNYGAFSGSGASFSYPWISSDEFTIYFNYTNRYNTDSYFVATQNSFGSGTALTPYVSGGRVTFSATGGYFTSGNLAVASGYDNASNWLLSPDSGVSISDIKTNFYSLSVGNPQKCGFNGTTAVLPTDNNVDPREIYDYYNDVIIPFIQQDSGDTDISPYLFIPYWVTPDPPEPPTFPNGGIQIGGNYDIDINIYVPTDASGQPVTDSQGETVIETAYITDTRPEDGNYKFLMPTMETLNIPEGSLPSPDLAPFSSGLAFIWNACYNILNGTGFMPVVIVCLSLALFGYILWKLGG